MKTEEERRTTVKGWKKKGSCRTCTTGKDWRVKIAKRKTIDEREGSERRKIETKRCVQRKGEERRKG